MSTSRNPKATPLDVPFGDDLLIEASAGTGKTYALTTLAARAIAEAAQPVERLLVVTFTVAATSELRDRLRKTLREAHGAISGNRATSDDQAAALAERWRTLGIAADAASRLQDAVRDLDRANILTIHGFCQRMLADFAFDGALPFGFEVSGDDAPAVAMATDDFWRRRIVGAPQPLLRHARREARGFAPAQLADWALPLHPKPDLLLRGVEDGDVAGRFEEAYAAFLASFRQVQQLWPDHGAAFLQTVIGLRFHKNSQNKANLVAKQVLAAFAGDDPDALALANAGYFGSSKLPRVTYAGQAMPEGPLLAAFHRLGEAAEPACLLADAWLRRQRRDLLDAVRESLRESAWQDRQLSFNALLTESERALAGPSGEALATRVRERYPLAFIDEFQDTDGLQARIFERIYPSRRKVAAPGPGETASSHAAEGVAIVGDPKQSIYGFRGADLFAFLQMSQRQGQRPVRLGANYRSTPGLVAAVNALFARRRPFLLHELGYDAVQSARDTHSGLRIGDKERAALLLRLDGDENGDAPGEHDMQRRAADGTAAEIAWLLKAGGDGRAFVDGQPLGGGDIAVLVRTGAQGKEMARALRERGVQSVELGDVDVFETAEAEQLHRLLHGLAAAAPHSEAAALRGALAAPMFGLSLQEAASLVDDRVWETWQRRFEDWRGIWRSAGVAALIRRLLFAPPTRCAATLLRQPGGPRSLTNMLHLADLLQQAETRERLEPPALAEWLARRRRDPRHGNDASQLRLESDERLVKVVTVHRSKGLEFPVVFYPFAWYQRWPSRRATAQYHEQHEGRYVEVLDLDPDDDARDRQDVEDRAEELRLLYVALTRAKYHCVATWARCRGHEQTALAWLLHGRGIDADEPAAAMKTHKNHMRKTLDASSWAEELTQFAAEHPAIATAPLFDAEEQPASPEAASGKQPASTDTAAAPAYQARALGRPLARVRRMTSYTALVGEHGAAVSAVEHAAAERPDHDQAEDAALAATAMDDPKRNVANEALTPFALPRGRRVGQCLHEVFEAAADPQRTGAAPGTDDFKRLCEDALRRHGIDGKWQPTVERIVVDVRETPLRPAGEAPLRLADFKQPLVEMEFLFPVAGLRRDRLGACLAAHGYGDVFAGLDADLRLEDAPEGAASDSPLAEVDGFLRGFIDLVGEYDGRWYVVDYKSNWLGDGAQDYAPAGLRQAMRRSGYALQYLLYFTALHRYLRLQLPDYDCERHLGGAFYLFVRGMTPAQPGHGVFHDAPSAACIEAIDACFGGRP